jgi:hypothetical protein
LAGPCGAPRPGNPRRMAGSASNRAVRELLVAMASVGKRPDLPSWPYERSNP